MEFEKRVQRSTAGWSRKPQGKARGPTIGKQRCWWSALAGRKNGDAKVPFEDSYFPRSHGCHTSSAILRLSLHCEAIISLRRGNNVRPKQRSEQRVYLAVAAAAAAAAISQRSIRRSERSHRSFRWVVSPRQR
ncbi:hypothetical protein V1477_019000 [Vespula maculifrons]|uniref:Uncharacterized protein n=1 Tax=Vespula maculifrons TaxID=7453 RepID=A0ABD2AT23_VESMC